MNKQRMKIRDAKIRAAAAAGEPTAAIATRFKITGSRVLQIVGGKPEEKRNKSHNSKGPAENEQAQKSIDYEFENQIAYAYGHVESWLSIFASVSGYPVRDVTTRVGELLSRKNVGKVVRHKN